MGQQHVCRDGQEQAHKDQDHCKEGHSQGQDAEAPGAADPSVPCHAEIKHEPHINYLV